MYDTPSYTKFSPLSRISSWVFPRSFLWEAAYIILNTVGRFSPKKLEVARYRHHLTYLSGTFLIYVLKKIYNFTESDRNEIYF